MIQLTPPAPAPTPTTPPASPTSPPSLARTVTPTPLPQSVVKIASRADVFAVELVPKARRRRKEQEGGVPSRGIVRKTRKRLQRFYARVLAERALVWTSPPKSAVHGNPLMLIGMGALLSRGDCETILDEAQEKNDWGHWDGDLGEDSEAVSLGHLPLLRALWSGQAGDAVRARIADIYGVQQSSVAVEPGDVFVCKAGPEGCGRAEMQGRWRQQQRRTGRREATIDIAPQQQQKLSGAVEFRRSKSLVSFCVALSAEETPSWAVCMEQRRQCLRPNGQGAGVVFSGKLRHACVTVSPETSAEARSGASGGDPAQATPPVILLRGFASIQHPSVREDVGRWRWGSPAWHVDAPWIKDQDILDRAWVGGDVSVGGVSEAAGATVEGVTPPAETVAAPGSSHHLERMNTSVAHRYYRQGLGGMDVPIGDPLGRPVIDLVEDGSSWLPGSKKPAEVTISAVLRRRFPWDRRRQVGKAGLSTAAGASPIMDAALQELFGASQEGTATVAAAAADRLVRVQVPPIKYVFVDPRYRGLGLGRRLFLEAMRSLARRGFRFALIIVEDNGSGGLFGFYEEMGFARADDLLGLPRAMIAPIPPPDDVL